MFKWLKKKNKIIDLAKNIKAYFRIYLSSLGGSHAS